MALSETEKRKMIELTHSTAWAMVDDLAHIRTILTKKDVEPGDIRRMSNELRRILIDNGGDIRKVAAPRIGRLELLAPDILPLIRSGERTPYAFLAAGVADVFGISIDAWMVDEGARPRDVPEFVPEQTVTVRLDGFLTQKVLCFKGKWARRADAIKYIANVAHGVHSGDPKEEAHEFLKHIRYAAHISMKMSDKLGHEIPSLHFDPAAFGENDPPITADRKVIDIVLLQLLSAARYLTLSPDVITLEAIIRSEAS